MFVLLLVTCKAGWPRPVPPYTRPYGPAAQVPPRGRACYRLLHGLLDSIWWLNDIRTVKPLGPHLAGAAIPRYARS